MALLAPNRPTWVGGAPQSSWPPVQGSGCPQAGPRAGGGQTRLASSPSASCSLTPGLRQATSPPGPLPLLCRGDNNPVQGGRVEINGLHLCEKPPASISCKVLQLPRRGLRRPTGHPIQDAGPVLSQALPRVWAGSCSKPEQRVPGKHTLMLVADSIYTQAGQALLQGRPSPHGHLNHPPLPTRKAVCSPLPFLREENPCWARGGDRRLAADCGDDNVVWGALGSESAP